MANSLDKLEKFFSKKKPGALPSPDEQLPFGAGPDILDQQQFPAPSFIRPKTNRMIARDEVLVNVKTAMPTARRAQSLPDGPVLSSPLTPSHASKQSTSSTGRLPDTPTARPPTIINRRREASIVMNQYQFMDLTLQNGGANIGHSRHSSIQVSPPQSPERVRPMRPVREASNAAPHPARADTPPVYEGDEKYMQAGEGAFGKRLPALPVVGNPTPEPTPPLQPVHDSQLPEPVIDDSAAVPRPLKFIKPKLNGPTRTGRTIRKAASHATLARSSTGTSGSSVLTEPTFRDFLSLGDEDVAERYPPAMMPPPFQLPPTPQRPTTPRRPSTATSSRKGSILTPSSLPSRPTAAGAYEAARLAAKYGFDLVYVLSLTPDSSTATSHDDSSLPTSPRDSAHSHSTTGTADGAVVSKRAGITGRLLAAHGLTPNQAPFGVSRSINSSILRSEGWVEFADRLGGANTKEWAKAYAHSFCTGHSSPAGVRRASGDSTATGSTASSAGLHHNRGIIFAAFRRHQMDGSDGRVSPESLRDLHLEAEALVEMLVEGQQPQRPTTTAVVVAPANRVAPRMPVPPPVDGFHHLRQQQLNNLYHQHYHDQFVGLGPQHNNPLMAQQRLMASVI